MKPIGLHNYFVYFLSNKSKKVLYVGVTNDLAIRLNQHQYDNINDFSFTKKYKCFYLIHFEIYNSIEMAINREKELKGWSRAKKNILIEADNPNWDFLNTQFD